MESLSDKLQSLGVNIGTKGLQPQPRVEKVNSFSIETVVNGIDFKTHFGDCFVVSETYPAGYLHGLTDLTGPTAHQILCQWAHTPLTADLSDDKVVFLDTETSGLSGGTGTFAFLIGLGFQKNGEFHLLQLFMRDPSDEPALLAALAHFLDPFQTVVTFNGKSFDIPLLKSRHVLNGFSSPFADLEHIDLLHLSRRLWRNRLTSRRLGSLEENILGVTRSGEEIPGWLVPEIYFEYLHTWDARPLKGVLYHNAIDILSLAGLWQYINQLLNQPMQTANVHSVDLASVARLFEDLLEIEKAVEAYELAIDQGLPKEFFLDTITRFGQLYRKQGNWNQALTVWQKGVRYKHIESCIEIAKFYEHVQKDPVHALTWVTQAKDFAIQPDVPVYKQKILGQELENRENRLKTKIAKAEKNRPRRAKMSEDTSKWVQVYAANGSLEGEMICNFLRANGITALMRQESLGQTYGLTVGPLGEASIYVLTEQEDDALELLQKMDEGSLIPSDDLDLGPEEGEQPSD